jgi:hypothetical protein
LPNILINSIIHYTESDDISCTNNQAGSSLPGNVPEAGYSVFSIAQDYLSLDAVMRKADLC